MINSVKKRRPKEVTVSDQTLASVGPARSVSGSSWARSRSSDRTLHGKSDRTRRACVRSVMTYADVAYRVDQRGSDAEASPVTRDRTRPITKQRLGELSVNDRTQA